jgi:hypothetical protein
MHMSMDYVNAPARFPGSCMHARISINLISMADRLSKLRDFLLFQVKRRRSLQKGSHRIPNTAAIARLVGTDQSTISRILRLKRNTVDAEDRTRPLPEYQPSAELIAGMMKAFGYLEEDELWHAILTAPAAPSYRPVRPRSRRRH